MRLRYYLSAKMEYISYGVAFSFHFGRLGRPLILNTDPVNGGVRNRRYAYHPKESIRRPHAIRRKYTQVAEFSRRVPIQGPYSISKTNQLNDGIRRELDPYSLEVPIRRTRTTWHM